MNTEKLLTLLRDMICTECGLVWGETGTGCDDCQAIRAAMAEPPAPLLPGVSAEELRELADALSRLGFDYWECDRAAAILRSAADAIEKGGRL